jgi:glycosyltransferase involved in cell wall biosynthesis
VEDRTEPAAASTRDRPVLYITAVVAGSGFYKPSMSGGDRIAANLAKGWIASGGKVIMFTTLSGKQIFENRISKGITYVILDRYLSKRRNLWAVLVFEARALIKGILGSLSEGVFRNPSVVYTPSHFWPDVISAILVSRRIPYSGLIGTFYLFPPPPFSRSSPYKGRDSINGLLFYLSQIGVAGLYRRFAKMIWVTNEYDKESMSKLLNSSKIPIVAVKGGIDWPATPRAKGTRPDFAGVFIGRLHPQKGLEELVQVWKLVVSQRPDLKLAIIGDGPLQERVQRMIRDSNLETNVTLFGFLDGEEKNAIIRKSKVVFYMSSLEVVAMAPIEAMALGLPCIAVNIPGRAKYFPRGTILTTLGNTRSSADALFTLLDDQVSYDRLSREAMRLAEEWRWESRGRILVREAQTLLRWNESE